MQRHGYDLLFWSYKLTLAPCMHGMLQDSVGLMGLLVIVVMVIGMRLGGIGLLYEHRSKGDKALSSPYWLSPLVSYLLVWTKGTSHIIYPLLAIVMRVSEEVGVAHGARGR